MRTTTFAKPKNKNSTSFSPVFGKKLSGRTFTPQSAKEARDVSTLEFEHNFGDVQVENQSFKKSCPLALSGTTHCPFGGACHTCLPRVQAKLKIGQPWDKYEQGANRLADLVMSMPESGFQRREPPQKKEILKAKPLVSQTKSLVQRQESGKKGHIAAPPIVHDVLRSPGQPLDTATRVCMESRFGHDFSRVRVHSDSLAAVSARAVTARAYTVGRRIVFGAGEYAHQTARGRELIAHELAHSVQQGLSETPPNAALHLDDPNGAVEREAGEVSRRALGTGDLRPHLQSSAQLARWAITGNIATMDSESDRLGHLPGKVRSSPQNWVCIKPLTMKTVNNPSPPGDFEGHYEEYLQKGDTFDISNLKTGYTGSSLKLSLFDASSNNHIVLSTLYPGTSTSKDPYEDIKRASGEGSTPIADLLIGGHQSGGTMYGKSVRLQPSTFSANEPAPSFSRARASKFPHRCWFTHFGNARSVCCSNLFGKDFAAVFLRKGSVIHTPTRAIHPTCTSAYRRPDGTCDAIDAVEFYVTSGEAITADHGPFKLSEVSKFHASIFWETIGGKL